jgi:hypothetical protein
VPFIDTVLDILTGNASWGILSIGKNYLSLWIPFTLLVSNVILHWALSYFKGGRAATFAERVI